MKMPKGPIDAALFAPCGMNCLVCYKHCFHKRPCEGCWKGEGGKPEHCRRCKMKACVQEKGLTYCYECLDFPCKAIKNLEKSYQTRYGASLMENSLYVKTHSLPAFMASQKQRFTCPVCSGVISLHDAVCSECRTAIAAKER